MPARRLLLVESEYFLGVDGGQSGTTAVIGDRDGRVVGWASAGPCNHVAGGEARAKFLRVMRECITEAADRAGVADNRFKAACFGMSGGPADKAALLRELIDAEHWMVTHDAAIALAGATGGEPGIVAIAGTGSMVFGQNARGETARAGGWGYLFGDEGSAFDIAKQAVRAAMREHEGWGGRTILMPALIEAGGVSDADELLHLLYTPEWTRDRIAAIAQIVSRVAEEGDPTATSILQNAARELALQVASVRRQLWTDGEAARISWAGGVFRSTIVLERFRMLVSIEGNNSCEEPKHGPAVGALLLAWRAGGVRVEGLSPQKLV